MRKTKQYVLIRRSVNQAKNLTIVYLAVMSIVLAVLAILP